MQIDRVHFYVDDAQRWRDWFINKLGCSALSANHDPNCAVVLVLSDPSDRQEVDDYLQQQPPGIADIALQVANLEVALHQVRTAGCTLSPIQQRQFLQGRMRWSKLHSPAGICHTLVERQGLTPVLPGPHGQAIALNPKYFSGIDHGVLNVAIGKLEETVTWYEQVLGFERQQTFTIQTERSGLYSQVLVHPDSGLQLPINEPSSPNSQIQEFLDYNRGPGVQHLALATKHIAQVTQQLRQAGLTFLSVSESYYAQLQSHLSAWNLSLAEWDAIVAQQILIDYQNASEGYLGSETGLENPLLLQIFTQPIFQQPTFFFEFIERRDRAKGFGEGNFRALFAAIEREQLKRETQSQ